MVLSKLLCYNMPSLYIYPKLFLLVFKIEVGAVMKKLRKACVPD